MSARRPRPRGAALILVLWLIALLTALVGGFALAARVENLQARVLVRGLVAQQVARAGLEYALTRIAAPDPRLRWRPDGRAYRWRYAGAEVEVRLVDENGKVDLNQADPALLAALLRAAGVEQDQAPRLAGAIVDWRDRDPLTQPAGGGEDADYASAGLPYGAKDAEFESVAELQQVLGMTPALYARLAPDLTVYSGRARPDPAFASARVLDAMGMNGAELVAQRERANPAAAAPQDEEALDLALAGEGSGTYSIDSHARLADGREARLRAVVRAQGSAVPGLAYTTLRWEEGASPQ
ncbi:general secretion pathway protein GspK [Vulcaniibacterium tengchongense]|uniref:Type II secretion system protein K n=1 Tax=Vulcaniibacterium tengchongense TaxID=1273429 RepID=A0A3N4VAG2_9GAMM|nr:type II secretion system protein GspK [Vulcaniibacterium tengchongense]RPE79558.1 type II secretion system protein K (GspK) [Vulcaniibacterium tengchongense]